MALFMSPDGQVMEKEDNYDPETGVNLAVKDFMSQVQAKGGNVVPINLFQDQNGQQVAVPYGHEEKFLKIGLKPVQQVEAEQSARDAYKNILSGNTGYTPDKLTSFLGSTASGATGDLVPQVEGAYSGIKEKLSGGDFWPAYQRGKDVATSVEANREYTNPISSALGKAVGEGATLVATGGTSSIPKMVAAGAGLGGTTGINQQINKNESPDLTDTAESAGIGGAEALGGALLGKGAQGLYGIASKAGKGVIPQEVRGAFLEGFEGKDLTDPDINHAVLKTGATYSKNLADTIGDIKSHIGKTKGDLLEQIGPIDHQPIINAIDHEQMNLFNKYGETAYSDEKTGINEAFSLLQEAKNDLKLNPHDPVAIDKAKQKLQMAQFDEDHPINKSRDATNSINDVRDRIKNYLEVFSKDLKGTNQGYKDIVDAEDATKFHNMELTPNEVIALGAGQKSPGAINKLDNLDAFYNKIRNNTSISQDLKDRLIPMIEDLENVSSRAAIAKKVSAGGLANVANQAGFLASKTPVPVKYLGKGVVNAGESGFKYLPVGVQQILSQPDYKKYLPKSMQDMEPDSEGEFQ